MTTEGMTTQDMAKVWLLLRYDGFTTKQIGDVYGVSSAYVSQLAPIAGARATGGKRRLSRVQPALQAEAQAVSKELLNGH